MATTEMNRVGDGATRWLSSPLRWSTGDQRTPFNTCGNDFASQILTVSDHLLHRPGATAAG